MEASKNKKLTYFLICAVAGVWGIILYRVFFNDPTEDYTVRNAAPASLQEPYDQYVLKEDTFSLTLNYRDPFLGGAPPIVEVKSDGALIEQVSFVPPAPEPMVDWGLIKYSGYIFNPVTNKTVCIITINGIERMLSEGESFEGARLLKNKKDSVLVSWNGQKKYIKQ